MVSKPAVTIHTDGGAAPNPGPGGWGAVLISAGGHEKEFSGAEGDTTNNRMELTAAIEALRALKEPCNITFFTDSEYVKNGITKWMRGWVKNGWQTKGDTPVKNRDLWQALHAEIQRHTIDWHWEKGHAGNEYNERVDRLATAAREALTGAPSEPDPVPAPDVAPDVAPDYEIAFRVSAGKNQAGGWAFRIVNAETGGIVHTLSGRSRAATASQLQIEAALAALEHVPSGGAVRVYCPSDYVYHGMTEWLSGWQRRGWKNAKGKPVAHRDLWEQLAAAAQDRRVIWVLEGHDEPAFARGLGKLAALAAQNG
ncbi:MAG: ribonuclease HI [Anaerolineae bacterium]|nr:ribonuclease HI [Anaerolineae bacterium]